MTLNWARHPIHTIKTAKARRDAWLRLFPPGAADPMAGLPAAARSGARAAAALIAAAHREYLTQFQAITARAKHTFETRDWSRGAVNAEERVRLYRDWVNGTWRELQRRNGERLSDRKFWMAARQAFLARVFDDYDADLALTFFYSTMRIAFDRHDSPVEYEDDGLAGRSHIWSPQAVWKLYGARPEQLPRSVERVLWSCEFRTPFEDLHRDAALVAGRLLREWAAQIGGAPRHLQMLRPVFYRDREAYLVGRLCGPAGELPVVLALRHEDRDITVDAVLAGKEDMRNILFISTRSTFHVFTGDYREVLAFLDTLAPERGHPAMAAVLGFTHPARVALNQSLRRHLKETGERFEPTPGRTGLAMAVFSPPSFPYVFKVVRDYSPKEGWTGRQHVMELYRWVHEMNRGRLMLDAWLYRNVHFPRAAFDERVIEELLRSAPGSVRIDSGTVVLKHVYAQRRVKPLDTFFTETTDPVLRKRAVDALGTFIKDLAAMGFFIGDHYGLTFNTGLTHALNVALFDFDDLGPILRYQFRETPRLAEEEDEMMWNTEADGAWFSVSEYDVLVDEWERYLGVPPELQGAFRRRHGDLFTTAYWVEVQRRVLEGRLHYVLPYPRERCLEKDIQAAAGTA